MTGQLPYPLRRLLGSVPSIMILTVFIFLLIRMVPGDPAAILIADVNSPEDLARVRAELGLDAPMVVQYALWLKHLAAGDFGTSFVTGQPVLGAIVRHFGITLQIVLPAFFIAALIAVPAGMTAARRQNTKADSLIVGAATLFLSVPSFWVAMMLILIFAAGLGWFPALGFISVWESPQEWLRHSVLPVAALVCVETAILTRLMRASTIEVLSQDYVANARAKGLPEGLVLRRHVLRNALSPTVTMMGLILGSLLSGTAVIETLFGIPGLGRLLVDSIYARDYPVLQGCLMFIVILYVAVNLLVDLVYPLLDPKVKLQ
jgi:peptide/nickel transport system permease protein